MNNHQLRSMPYLVINSYPRCHGTLEAGVAGKQHNYRTCVPKPLQIRSLEI